MKIIFSKKCLEYEAAGHPESPQRLESTYDYLKEKGFEFIEPLPATEKDILLAHTSGLLRQVKNLDFFEPDTPALPNIFDYACLSVGAAIRAMELSINSEPAFSLMRPPGHHAAGAFLGGFCYFNNLAIAVKKALVLDKKIAILDIDCHHGNGTQDIFLGERGVLYVSLHQTPLYPGTGLKSEKNCLNFPLRPLTKEEDYLKTLKCALNEIKDFSAELLAVSAGFDTYCEDPLANMGLEISSFRKIAELIKAARIPYFCVLEGGYSPQLKDCIYGFVEGLL